MKLEELLGEELYAKVREKIDAKNANEPDKLKHVRYADLSEGGYLSKEKHTSEMEQIKTALSGKESELTAANALIEQLKKGTKGDEALQGKITAYETQVQGLQEELAKTKVEAAIKVALMSEKAVDVDYLTFKLNEKLKEDGSKLELDENGSIKGWDDKIADLKTQFPKMFETAPAGGAGGRKYEERRLQKGDGPDVLTRGELLKKSYSERARIAQEDPEAYSAAMNGN